MKKITRLSETDLTRLVRRIIKEQYEDDEIELNTHNVDDTGATVYQHSDELIFLKNKSSRQVQRAFSNMSPKIRFIAIINCEYADFSDVDICKFPRLLYINLKNTPNNFEEVVDCDYLESNHGYEFKRL